MGKLSDVTATSLEAGIPTYQVNSHGEWLAGYSVQVGDDSDTLPFDETGARYSYNIKEAIEDAIDINPYGRAYWRDPADELTEVKEAIREFKTLIDAYDPETDFESFVTKASTLFSTYGIDMSDQVADETDAYEATTDDQYYRSLDILIARGVAMNNVESTWFGLGLANLANTRTILVNDFASKLFMQAKRDKSLFLLEASKLMMALQASKTSYLNNWSQSIDACNRFQIVAKGEKVEKDFEYFLAETRWPIEQIKEGLNALGAMQGVPQLERGPSRLQNALAAALSAGPQVGLALGDAAGSVPLGLASGGIAATLAFFGNLL